MLTIYLRNLSLIACVALFGCGGSDSQEQRSTPFTKPSRTEAETTRPVSGIQNGDTSQQEPQAPVVAPGTPRWPDMTVRYKPLRVHLKWGAVSGVKHYRLLIDLGDGDGYSVLADRIAGREYTLHVSVHQFDWQSTRFKVQAVTGSGIKDSRPVSVEDGFDKTILNTTLSGPFPGKGGDAGCCGNYYSVVSTLSGNGKTLVIGIPEEPYRTASGAVYVYQWDEKKVNWVLDARIVSQHPQKESRFGDDVDISFDGSLLAIGEPGEDGGVPGVNGAVEPTAGNSGAVHLYEKRPDGWKYVAYIKSDDPLPNARFGEEVDLSDDGEILIVDEAKRKIKGPPFGPNGADASLLDSTSIKTVTGKFYFFNLKDRKNITQSRYFIPNVYENRGVSLRFLSDSRTIVEHGFKSDNYLG